MHRYTLTTTMNKIILVFFSTAYVEFNTPEQAEKALKALAGASMKGESILVDFVGAKSQNRPDQKKSIAMTTDPGIDLHAQDYNNLSRYRLII